ncbi:MAG: hypothetical protein IKU08_09195 [Clostridia bacterium]|nr:hypothetical protein [Clostridia bacterium]
MLFEVTKNGYGMKTDHIKCIPSRAQLLSMQKNGYTFKLNGKPATVAKISKVIADK